MTKSHFLDLQRWPRREIYDFFRGYDHPHFNICTRLEVGALRALVAAQPDLPFFLSYLYLSLRVANEVEPFRYRLRGERLLVYERVHGSAPVLFEDQRFVFTYFRYHDAFAAFREEAEAVIARVRAAPGALDPRGDQDDLLHYSVLPWIHFSSFSNPRRHAREDAVPKIVFGKVAEEGGRWWMPISVEVHHALMDGLHVGQYLERLQGYLSEPAAALGLSRP